MDSFSLEARAATTSTRNYGIGCHAWNPKLRNAFGYQPSLAAGIVFVILFSIITFTHLAQVIISRKWWYLVFVAGAIGKKPFPPHHTPLSAEETPTNKSTNQANY